MITYYLQVVLCMAVFYGFYHIALRKETLFQSNRTYLLLTLLISFIIPLINVYIEVQQERTVLVQAPLYVGSYLQSMEEAIAVSPATASFSWLNAAGWGYAAVVCFLLIKMLMSIMHIMRIRRNGMEHIIGGQCCIVSPEIKCPFSFFNTIYMPLQHGFDADEILEVMRHERAHVTGNHTLDVILVELACIVMWLNPFVYLYRKSLKDLHEYMADHAVIEDTPWDSYAQLLISNKDNSFQTRLSNHLIFSQLKKRLLMMNKQRTGFSGRIKYVGILPVILVALILFSFRQRDNIDSTPENSQMNVNKSPDPVLYITDDDRYFLDGISLEFDELADAFKEAIKSKTDWTIAVIFDEGMTVGEISHIMELGYRQQIAMVGHTGKEWDRYKESIRQSAKTNREYKLYEDGLSLKRLDPLTGKLSPLSPLSPMDAKLDLLDMENPIFPGCENLSMDEQQKCSMEKLYAYIAANLAYPESLQKSGLEGKVFVKFVVGADGRVKDVAIQKSLHPDADEAVLKLVKDINLHAGKWQPALKDGKAVDAEMILPISFALNDVLQSAEEFPRITGCEHITDIDERKQCATSRMYKFIAEHLVYPQADKDAGIEGMAIVQFVILREGEMVDIRVVRSPSPTMREEVLRVFNLMAEENRWIPATLDGEAVNLQLTVPVKFKLTDETKEEVAEENKPASLVITPNPSQDKITFAVFEGAHTVMIADASGKQVATQKIDGQATSVEMSVGHLISGRYIVQLIGADKTLSGVFVKQ